LQSCYSNYISRMKPYILVVSLVLLLACRDKSARTSANQPLSNEELFDTYRKSVVLIQNKSYYRIRFAGGVRMYCTEINSNGHMYLSENEDRIRKEAEINYGTGFFVNERGVIATNLHVLAPIDRLLEEMDFKNSVSRALKNWSENEDRKLSVAAHRLAKTVKHDSLPGRAVSSTHLDTSRHKHFEPHFNGYKFDSVNRLKVSVDSILSQARLVKALLTQDFTIELMTADLDIYLDGATSNEDAYACRVIALSQDKNIDLALIQTAGHEVPEEAGPIAEPIYLFDTIKVTTPLYLIGYNYGPEIAKTAAGLKVQFTRGEVSQESDQYRVLYTIPALTGSSGSPVFDQFGRLVAINYKGYNTKENFNYGIHAGQLRKLLRSEKKLSLPL